MDVMEDNTGNDFSPFNKRKKCHIWTSSAARLGKGQSIRRREAVDHQAQHHPEDVLRQMADLAAVWSWRDLQALPTARQVHNTAQAGRFGAGCILSNMPYPTGSTRDAS